MSQNDPWPEFNFNKSKIFAIVGILLAIVFVITLFSGLTIVDATERAVVFHKTNGNLSILSPGFHYVLPVLNDVTKYDIKETTFTDSAEGISLDLQVTKTEVTVLYSPDPLTIQTIHQKLGTSYEKKIVLPAVQQCVKNAVSNYNVEQLTGAIRLKVNNDIGICITAALKDNYLIASKISITDFDFSDQFNKAIEAKAVAQQAAQEEKNRLEQVKYKANQTIIQAEAQSRAVRLLNDANAGSQNNNYLFLEWLKVWDGKLPVYFSDSGNSGLNVFVGPPAPSNNK